MLIMYFFSPATLTVYSNVCTWERRKNAFHTYIRYIGTYMHMHIKNTLCKMHCHLPQPHTQTENIELLSHFTFIHLHLPSYSYSCTGTQISNYRDWRRRMGKTRKIERHTQPKKLHIFWPSLQSAHIFFGLLFRFFCLSSLRFSVSSFNCTFAKCNYARCVIKSPENSDSMWNVCKSKGRKLKKKKRRRHETKLESVRQCIFKFACLCKCLASIFSLVLDLDVILPSAI